MASRPTVIIRHCPDYDVQRIELELAAYDDQVASAEVEVAAARSRLGALIGVAAVEAMSDLALPAAPAAIDGLAAGAVEARGDYRAAAARRTAADAWAGLAARGSIPDLGIAVGVMANDGAGGAAIGATLGLALSLPTFDRGQGVAAQARAREPPQTLR